MSQIPAIPALRGTYILIFSLFQPVSRPVGRGVPVVFPSGGYAYIGSAFGPGGLYARISHHLRTTKKNHWHIDQLLPSAVMQSIFFSTYPEHLECAWAQIFSAHPEFQAPVRRFGASDCASKCPAHLFHFSNETDLSPWLGSLRSPFPGKELAVWMRDI